MANPFLTDERTGLSSYGQSLLSDVLLRIEALETHLVQSAEAYDKVRADVQAAWTEQAAPVTSPVTQPDVDALRLQIEDLNKRLAQQQAQQVVAVPSGGPPAAPGPAASPAPPAVESAGPFPGQAPMVTQPGPTA